MSRQNKSRNKNNQNRKAPFRVIESGQSSRAITSLPLSTAPNNNIPAYESPLTMPPAIMGGRQTQPSNVNPLGLLSYSFLPRRQYQDIDLTDILQASALNAQQLLEMFADLSPEVSMAVWNRVRLINGGYQYQVRTKTGDRELKKAQNDLKSIVDSLNKDYGGIDALINAWSLTAFLQGAIAGELALTEDLQGIDDLYAVQPWTIYFERDGYQKLVPFQQQVSATNPSGLNNSGLNVNPSSLLSSINGGADQIQGYPGTNNGYGVAGYPYRRLNPLTFAYIPVDAGPDDPYGRSPAAPVLQLIAFDLQLLKDLKQATHMNAWGRLHITLLEETILKNAPQSVKMDPTGAKQRDFVNTQLASFQSAYNGMKPDDAVITTDSAKLTPIDFAGKTFNVDTVLRMTERRLIRALKELPVLMGSNEGTTETHGTVQMDIYAAGIRSFQKTIASLLEKLLTVAMEVLGYSNARVSWEFEPPRATDLLQDMQAEEAKSNLLAYQRDQGWISQDDASIQATGSKAVADPLTAPVSLNQKDAQPFPDKTGESETQATGKEAAPEAEAENSTTVDANKEKTDNAKK